MVIERYMGGYLDRRMKYHIEEWQLATRRDIADEETRLAALKNEVAGLSASAGTASDRLAKLEDRVRRLKEEAKK
jgi:hypothetical protein